jgi:hypothetical protein
MMTKFSDRSKMLEIVDVMPIPEPGTWPIMLCGAAVWFIASRRKPGT